MKIYRIKLRPLSAWRSAWQADTLAGLLCWALARSEGGQVLEQEILQPCAAGQPPFVLSDAFPLDFLPVPEMTRFLVALPSKQIKQARYLAAADFRRAQSGAELPDAAFRDEKDFIRREAHLHNTLDRHSDTTDAGGGLFSLTDFFGIPQSGDTDFYLSVYARIEAGYVERLQHLFEELAHSGFGADVSAGKGHFDVTAPLTEVAWLDEAAASANALAVLSSFQPAPDDPTQGFWETFTKFGKLGADFGFDNVFKRPLVLLKPGACLQTTQQKDFVGRLVRMEEILTTENIALLQAQGRNVNQLCYGLAVPFVWRGTI